MNTNTHILTTLLLVALLAPLTLTGCGPKMVGEDTPKAHDGYTNPGSEPEAQLRYPISGSRTEQRLYYMNQPQIMEARQQKQREYFNRRMGLQDSQIPGGDNSLFPRRYSPFR